MISPVFLFLLPVAFVTLSCIECYRYPPGVLGLRREGGYNENSGNGFYPIKLEELDTSREAKRNDVFDEDYFKRKMAAEIYLPVNIPSHRITTGTKDNKRGGTTARPVNEIKTIPTSISNDSIIRGKKFDLDESKFHVASDYGFYPIPLEALDTSREAKRNDAFDEDYFKRKMAAEIYLDLWKHLDRIEDSDK